MKWTQYTDEFHVEETHDIDLYSQFFDTFQYVHVYHQKQFSIITFWSFGESIHILFAIGEA